MKLMNEAAIMVENSFIKKAYKYDYFIQVDLHTVNGLTLKDSQQDGVRLPIKQKTPIANIFIRVINDNELNIDDCMYSSPTGTWTA